MTARIARTLAITLVLTGATQVAVASPTTDELEERIDDLEREVAELRAELDARPDRPEARSSTPRDRRPTGRARPPRQVYDSPAARLARAQAAFDDGDFTTARALADSVHPRGTAAERARAQLVIARISYRQGMYLRARDLATLLLRSTSLGRTERAQLESLRDAAEKKLDGPPPP